MTHFTMPWGRVARLTLAGGLAFWVANFAISQTALAAAYREALSIAYWPMTLAALIGGLLVAGCVSGLLLTLRDRIPGVGPVFKATFLSLVILAVIEAFSLVLDADHLTIFHVVGAVINLPRFLALAVTIGWLSGADPRPVDAIPGSVR